MSERNTRLMTIIFDNNKDQYNTFEEAEKVANALKSKLEYIRSIKDNYYINAFIGISPLNPRFAYLKFRDNKKPGRNKLYVVPRNKYKHDNKSKCFEPWHLHIVIEANPGETVVEMVADYFNKKFKRKIATKRPITNDNMFFKYVMEQSPYIRYVEEKRSTDKIKYDFKEKYKKFKPHTKSDKKESKKLDKMFMLNRLEKYKKKNGQNPNNSKDNRI